MLNSAKSLMLFFLYLVSLSLICLGLFFLEYFVVFIRPFRAFFNVVDFNLNIYYRNKLILFIICSKYTQ